MNILIYFLVFAVVGILASVIIGAVEKQPQLVEEHTKLNQENLCDRCEEGFYNLQTCIVKSDGVELATENLCDHCKLHLRINGFYVESAKKRGEK